MKRQSPWYSVEHVTWQYEGSPRGDEWRVLAHFGRGRRIREVFVTRERANLEAVGKAIVEFCAAADIPADICEGNVGK
jgi:hypothetical protein